MHCMSKWIAATRAQKRCLHYATAFVISPFVAMENVIQLRLRLPTVASEKLEYVGIVPR